MAEEQWYTNKDLFEMVQALKAELQSTRLELQTTNQNMRQYNDLRGTMNDVIRRVTCMEEQSVGRQTVGRAIREWGGWVIGVTALVFTILKFTKGAG